MKNINGNSGICFKIRFHFWAEHAGLYHDDINMVMFPSYADREKRWEITDEMKQQRVLEEMHTYEELFGEYETS